MALHEKQCVACSGGTPKLTAQQIAPLQAQLKDWAVSGGHHLEKEWRWPDFATALAFLNRAGAVCEEQGHHADFEVGWGRVKAKIWTHKVDGLTESDFVLAAKLDHI